MKNKVCIVIEILYLTIVSCNIKVGLKIINNRQLHLKIGDIDCLPQNIPLLFPSLPQSKFYLFNSMLNPFNFKIFFATSFVSPFLFFYNVYIFKFQILRHSFLLDVSHYKLHFNDVKPIRSKLLPSFKLQVKNMATSCSHYCR